MAEASHEQLFDQMKRRGLFFGERPLSTVLRPRFLSPEQYRFLRQQIRPLLRAFRKISVAAVADKTFCEQFNLNDWEKELILVHPG